ncbi:hypothetical protein KM043_001345 [Ampulex compressa]|nr:hypothetical protein KM043_001345 [Ampulex compressa]
MDSRENSGFLGGSVMPQKYFPERKEGRRKSSGETILGILGLPSPPRSGKPRHAYLVIEHGLRLIRKRSGPISRKTWDISNLSPDAQRGDASRAARTIRSAAQRRSFSPGSVNLPGAGASGSVSAEGPGEGAYVHETLFTFYGVRTGHKSGTGDHKTVVFAPKVYAGSSFSGGIPELGIRPGGQGARGPGACGGPGGGGRGRDNGPSSRKTLRHFGAPEARRVVAYLPGRLGPSVLPLELFRERLESTHSAPTRDIPRSRPEYASTPCSLTPIIRDRRWGRGGAETFYPTEDPRVRFASVGVARSKRCAHTENAGRRSVGADHLEETVTGGASFGHRHELEFEVLETTMLKISRARPGRVFASNIVFSVPNTERKGEPSGRGIRDGVFETGIVGRRGRTSGPTGPYVRSEIQKYHRDKSEPG